MSRKLAGVLLGLFAVGSLVRADSLELVNGTTYDDVTFLSVTWSSVEFRVKRTKRKVAAEDVASISRDSNYLDTARAFLSRGDYEAAAGELKVLEPTKKTQPWEKAEADYLLGDVLFKQGKPQEAATAIKKYIDTHKDLKDWWIPFATNRLGEISLSRKQWGTAGVYFKNLQTYGGQWEWRAKLGQGTSLLNSRGKGGTQDARKLFLEVVRNSKNPSLQQKAKVERIRAVLVAEQPDRAIEDLNKDFFVSPSSKEFSYGPARAWATLLMGEALFGQGSGAEGKENLQKAEMWFLRVEALYKQNNEVYARACEQLSALYTKLGKAQQAAEWKKRKPKGY